MTYPRTIIIDNPNLKTLLEEKKALIESGREVSGWIEDAEKNLEKLDKKIQKLESQADTKNHLEEAEKLTEQFNKVVAKMDALKKKMFEDIKKQVPQDLITEFETKAQEKENLERERNKIALKAQKYTDKIIPLAQKEVKPLLQDEFEDLESLKVEKDQIVGTIFNHLDDFKKAFEAKRKK